MPIKFMVWCDKCHKNYEIDVAKIGGDLTKIKCDHVPWQKCHRCGKNFKKDFYDPYNYCKPCLSERGLPTEANEMKMRAGVKMSFIVLGRRDKKSIIWGEE